MALPVFLAMLLGSFALFTLAVGLFTAYFGAGKSRRIGTALTLLGLVAALLFAAVTTGLFPEVAESPWSWSDVLVGLMALLGAGVGMLVSLLIFLGSIMRA